MTAGSSSKIAQTQSQQNDILKISKEKIVNSHDIILNRIILHKYISRQKLRTCAASRLSL